MKKTKALQPDSKMWFTSKTIWLSLTGIVGIGVNAYMQQRFLTVEEQAAIVGMILNIWIRFKTSQPVKFK